MPVPVPAGLEAQRRLGPDWAAWLERLPARTAELLAEWDLQVDGGPLHGYCSLVVPVRTPSGVAAVLKVTYDGDEESRHEPLALRTWTGPHTVRLLRADPHRRALLLERLTTADLWSLPVLEACEVVAGLYAELHVPAPPRVTPVATHVRRWLADLAASGTELPLPRRMVQQTLSLGGDLLEDPARVLVHGDLHGANVLAADDGTWTVIDPKAMAGDPHYEPAPMLWNRWDEYDPHGLRTGVRARFHTLVDVAGLDEERARDWVVVRMVLNAHWAVADARRAGRDLDSDERRWISRCLTVAKAVQG